MTQIIAMAARGNHVPLDFSLQAKRIYASFPKIFQISDHAFVQSRHFSSETKPIYLREALGHAKLSYLNYETHIHRISAQLF
jgi:hypothetical protein